MQIKAQVPQETAIHGAYNSSESAADYNTIESINVKQ